MTKRYKYFAARKPACHRIFRLGAHGQSTLVTSSWLAQNIIDQADRVLDDVLVGKIYYRIHPSR